MPATALAAVPESFPEPDPTRQDRLDRLGEEITEPAARSKSLASLLPPKAEGGCARLHLMAPTGSTGVAA